MGYGHQRAAFALGNLAPERSIINANDYPDIPAKDEKIWQSMRNLYEFISKFKKIPLVGQGIFFLFDQIQKIQNFYPKRDLSKPNFQLKQTYSLIKKGLGKDLIERLSKKKLPLISTFFTPAFMAEEFHYPKDIFCLICDADISRTWAPLRSKRSKIKYLVPTQRAAERLKLYGVKEKNISLTGFPLPLENIGDEKLEILKGDLSQRLVNLDPKKRFSNYYQPLIKKHLGKLPKKANHPLTLMFAVGGAGAQKEIGVKITRALSKRIRKGEIKVILVAGIREEVKEYFLKKTKGIEIEIIFEKEIERYFQRFNQALRKTDILWTKPSELSFYCALGLPLIIAPTVGSQEKFNKQWLLQLGAGINQKDPLYTDQWLFDLLAGGYLAEAAFQGFLEAEKLGTLNIKKTVLK